MTEVCECDSLDVSERSHPNDAHRVHTEVSGRLLCISGTPVSVSECFGTQSESIQQIEYTIIMRVCR
jgi:hypothetical protein